MTAGRRSPIIDDEHSICCGDDPRQSVLIRLVRLLYAQTELAETGRVFVAPAKLQLTATDVVIPAAMVVVPGDECQVTDSRIVGRPRLVVEFVCGPEQRNQIRLREAVYRSCQVPEVWILDPRAQTCEQLILVDGRFRRQSLADRIAAGCSDDLVADLTTVWSSGRNTR